MMVGGWRVGMMLGDSGWRMVMVGDSGWVEDVV